MLEQLKTEAKLVGVKQIRKALARHEVKTVFLAADADPFLTQPIAEACRADGVELISVPSMQELGRACGIQVGSACAAILRG